MFILFYSKDNPNDISKIRDLFKEVAPGLRTNRPKIWFAEIDISEADKVKAHFGINHTPKLELYVDTSRHMEYKGKVEEEALTQWLIKRCNLPSKEIKTPEDFDKISTLDKAFVVYIGSTSCSNYVLYQETAKLFLNEDDLFYFHVNN